MLKASRSAARIVSPLLQRHSQNASRLSCAQEMSSDAKSTKSTNPSTSQGVSKAKSEQPVIEKGDSYKAGDEYFSYNSYSFYDIENSMAPQRCQQPSSEKMKNLCLDKLNKSEEEIQRKLLAEDFGDLEEYPGKVVPVKVEKPMEPVMTRRYDLGEKTMEKENDYKARMPM